MQKEEPDWPDWASIAWSEEDDAPADDDDDVDSFEWPWPIAKDVETLSPRERTTVASYIEERVNGLSFQGEAGWSYEALRVRRFVECVLETETRGAIRRLQDLAHALAHY